MPVNLYQDFQRQINQYLNYNHNINFIILMGNSFNYFLIKLLVNFTNRLFVINYSFGKNH